MRVLGESGKILRRILAVNKASGSPPKLD